MYSIFIYIDKYQLYMCWLVHTIPLRPSFGRSNANDQKNAVCFFPLRNSLSLRSYEASFWAETWWIHCVLKYSMTSEYFLVTSFDPRCSKNVQKTTILTYSTKEYIYIEIQYDFKTHGIDLTTKQLICLLSCLPFTHGKKTPKLSKTTVCCAVVLGM